MVKTHGLSHVALSVVDLDRSLAFYRSVFGVREYFRNDSTVQVLGPGRHRIRPADIDAAIAAVESAGGTVTSRGEFGPG